jgi:hypothetical protein
MDVTKSHLLKYCGSYYGSNDGGLEAMFQAFIFAPLFLDDEDNGDEFPRPPNNDGEYVNDDIHVS